MNTDHIEIQIRNWRAAEYLFSKRKKRQQRIADACEDLAFVALAALMLTLSSVII